MLTLPAGEFTAAADLSVAACQTRDGFPVPRALSPDPLLTGLECLCAQVAECQRPRHAVSVSLGIQIGVTRANK
jgi:hypothetical protein